MKTLTSKKSLKQFSTEELGAVVGGGPTTSNGNVIMKVPPPGPTTSNVHIEQDPK